MTTTQTPVRETRMLPRRFAAAAFALALAACGGTNDDVPATTAGPSLRIDAPSQAGTAYVAVEGCVATGVFMPRQATVGVVSADGRLLATSSTNEDGVFVVQVPINTKVDVSVLEPGGYSIGLAVGTRPIVLTACLRVGGAA